ncbi:MAG: glycosyltransferase family 4 protein [Chitinophagaceae bacterium]|nr:glycosyltransferase family 4 protein [Chitinophagaceae bacterium]MCA6486881.1 glycosyltransferase family 4 protein [Chitinophagaceae bacterium]MCE2971995.1 glycosyltransferase family 4 protein [Sediminibacterium sp.]
MRVLIVSQYFWPETFRINDMALGLKERGYEVTVLTSIPNYPEGQFFPGYSFLKNSDENWNGISIYRCKQLPRGKNNPLLLSLNYISFAFFASWRVFSLPKKIDRILVYQVSPVLQVFPALVAAHRLKCPVFVNVQDLWPETFASTQQGKKSFFRKWVGSISNYLYRKADHLLLPFKSSQPILEQRGIPANKMSYLPNSVDSFYLPVSQDHQYESLFTGETHFLLTGNLGEAQGIELIIEAAHELKDLYPNLRWILVGDGRNRQELEQLVREKKVENIVSFPGRYPATVIPYLIARADASLLTLKKEPIFAITVPNRLQSYMACGKPILASIDGEAADIINESVSGLVAAAGDLQGFVELVKKFMNTSEEQKKQWGMNARSYFLSHFERNQVLDQLNDILQQEIVHH